MVQFVGIVAVVVTLLTGCFLVSSSLDRPDPGSVSGPAVYREGCEMCHAAPVGAAFATSVHAARGIRCGQCHTPGGHPNFAQPVADAKCGGCHQAEYQQTLASRHFATRTPRSLDADRPARAALRREGFVARGAAGGHFVGDAASGALGGRLCAACHYDEHRLSLAPVQRADFCGGCHAGRDGHYPIPTPAGGPSNRCLVCHLRVGETVNGQLVNTHRFTLPGAAGGS